MTRLRFRVCIFLAVLLNGLLIFVLQADENTTEMVMGITFVFYAPIIYISRMIFLDLTVEDIVRSMNPFASTPKDNNLFLSLKNENR